MGSILWGKSLGETCTRRNISELLLFAMFFGWAYISSQVQRQHTLNFVSCPLVKHQRAEMPHPFPILQSKMAQQNFCRKLRRPSSDPATGQKFSLPWRWRRTGSTTWRWRTPSSPSGACWCVPSVQPTEPSVKIFGQNKNSATKNRFAANISNLFYLSKTSTTASKTETNVKSRIADKKELIFFAVSFRHLSLIFRTNWSSWSRRSSRGCFSRPETLIFFVTTPSLLTTTTTTLTSAAVELTKSPNATLSLDRFSEASLGQFGRGLAAAGCRKCWRPEVTET